MSRSLLLVAALVLTPSLAVAGGSSKAWNAAKKVHPDTPIIAGLDVASAKSSESFKTFFPLLLKKEKSAQEVLDRLQKECSFDPFVAINSIVAVIDDTAGDKGAFYIALNGWDAKKLGECAKKIGKSEQKDIKVGGVAKGIQTYEMVGTSERIYLGWLGKDVVVIATEPTDKAFVESMMKGKGAGNAGKLARKLDTSATVWMAAIKSQSIQRSNGTLAADARLVTGAEQQASSLVDEFNRELPKLQGSLPPAAQALAKSMKVTAHGAEVHATASAPEKDVLSLIKLLLATL